MVNHLFYDDDGMPIPHIFLVDFGFGCIIDLSPLQLYVRLFAHLQHQRERNEFIF